MTGERWRDERWPSEWMRAVLPQCVLGIVAHTPVHDYAIAARLADSGLGDVKGGTLYPILARLERDGLVTATWVAGEGGPGRKVFEATAQGIAHLQERNERWLDFTQTVDRSLATGRVR